MREYLVMMSGEGNPDMRQYAPIAPPTSQRVATLREAQNLCRSYIKDWDLGVGNWVGEAGMVYLAVGDNCKYAGKFSYNGRFWRNTKANKAKGYC